MRFQFTETDLSTYTEEPKWGTVGLITFIRTYSRPIYAEDGTTIVGRESWKDVCKRVIEGSMNLVENDPTATREWALKAFHLMYNFAWMPPGRGLWMMGTQYTEKRGGDALVNCWYTDVRPYSYENISMFEGTHVYSDPVKPMPSFPFVFMFDRAMLGGGVGFGTAKENMEQFDSINTKVHISLALNYKHPDWQRIVDSEEWERIKMCTYDIDEDLESLGSYDPSSESANVIQITDSREGWAVAVRELIDAHWSNEGTTSIVFDFSKIREYGALIKGFGGTASGPLSLMDCLVMVNNVLNRRVGKNIRSIDAVDIMNLLGRCVVSGNVRRTALIALGHHDDTDYVNAKNYELVEPIIDRSFGDYGWYTNAWGRKTQKLKPYDQIVSEVGKERADELIDIFICQDNHRWASNNSVYTFEMFKDYHYIANSLRVNGEPGIVNKWLMQNFGRICDGFQAMLDKATGVNPCGEITLESEEPCNLAEVVPYICHTGGFNIEDAIYIATTYTYRVTMAKYMWPQTQRVIDKNRRIGVSLTGMSDYFLAKFGNYAVTDFAFGDDGNIDISKPIFDPRIVLELDSWYQLVKKFNREHAEMLGTQPSIKVTTCKPSGTVAKLPGVSSGIHWHYAPYLIQRIRFHDSDPLLPVLKVCNYPIEKDMKVPNTMVVEFPVKAPNADNPNFKCSGNISLEEQFANQYLFAYAWADNAVSATLTFKPGEEDSKIEPLLRSYTDKIKSTSMLPYYGHGLVQAPWEPISKEEYERREKEVVPFEIGYKLMKVGEVGEYLDTDCVGGSCPLK